MKKLIKEIPRALVISLVISTVLILIDYIVNAPESATAYQSGHYVGIFVRLHFFNFIFYSITLYFVNATLFIKLNDFYGIENYSRRRIIIGFISSLFVTLITILILQFFREVVINKLSFSEFVANEKLANYIVSSIITFLVVLGIHAFHFYKKSQENKVKEQKIIAGTANAKFESLKNQIDPHFLFNSLNVLSSLIEENPENAQRFTTSLSKVYRYVLEQKDKELVPVDEELAFAKTYMNLLKMRFENSLSYELPANYVEIDSSLAMAEMKVVPLSLQLLLENAVKHNVISEQRPLHIKIFIKDDFLCIENNFQKKEVLQDRNGVGLQNIISRYGIITNRKVIIDQNEQTYTVKIPILTKQITTIENVNYNEKSIYYKAKIHLEELKNFYRNLITGILLIPILIFINLTYMPKFQWFWFPVFIWSGRIIMHFFKAFVYSSDWEENKIQEILNKEEHKQNWK